MSKSSEIEAEIWTRISKDLSNLSEIKQELVKKQQNITRNIENLENETLGPNLVKDDFIVIQKSEDDVIEIPIEIFHKYQEISKVIETEKYLKIYSSIIEKNILHQKCIETQNIEKSIDIIKEMEKCISELKELTLNWCQIDNSILKIFEKCVELTWKISTTKLDEIMSEMHWPFHSETSNKIDQSKSIRLAISYSYLTHIHSASNSIKILPTPMHLLLRNLEKRFLYHFTGKKESNCLDKPEWCFEQVLKWIEINLKFIETNFTDVVKEKFDSKYRNVSRDFISELSKWVINKVKTGFEEIEELPFSESVKLFSHWVDEIIEFQQNLSEMGFTPQGEDDVMELLRSEKVIPKILEIEQNTSESILSNFEVGLDGFGRDWAHGLLVEIKAMQKRADIIGHSGYSLQTIGLIQNILNEMLERVKERFKKIGISKTSMPEVVIMLNGVTVCGENIQKMQEEQFFLKIASISNSQQGQFLFFDDVISNINGLQTQIIESIQIFANNIILKSANEYANLEWMQKLPPKDDVIAFDIPKSFVSLLSNVNSAMECIMDINTNMRTHICLQVSDQLDKYLFEKIFLEKFPNFNLFSIILFHLQKFLFPLYSKFANLSAIFQRLRDVIHLFARTEVELSLILRDIKSVKECPVKSSPSKKRVDINSKYGILYLDTEDVKYLVSQRMNQLSKIRD